MTTVVQDFFHHSVPPKLWHYTTIGNLEKILASKEMWATEVRWTTDASEFVHAHQFIVQSLTELSEDDENQRFAKNFALNKFESDFNEGTLSPNYQGLFIVSLSEARDTMSQWGWYGERGYGVSIALDLTDIRPSPELQSLVTFAPCIYTESDKIQLVRAAVRSLADNVSLISLNSSDPAWIKENINHFSLIRSACTLSHTPLEIKEDLDALLRKRLIAAATGCLFDSIRLCCHCKHNAFSQEEEWRLTLPVKRTELSKAVRHRGNHIPYIGTNFFQNKLPITEVMMGPRCEEEDRVAEILKKFQYDVPVTKSDIPLRDPEKLYSVQPKLT